MLEELRKRARPRHTESHSFDPLARVPPVDKPTTGYDDVRMVAMSRLALKDVGAVPISIEVDWTLYGPKLAQVALTFGADHLDAVPATSDPQLGPRRATVEDVERNIRAAGFRTAGISTSMSIVRLGAVSYLNTKPLVHGLDRRRTCSRCASTCPRSVRRCCTRDGSISA